MRLDERLRFCELLGSHILCLNKDWVSCVFDTLSGLDLALFFRFVYEHIPSLDMTFKCFVDKINTFLFALLAILVLSET